MAMRNTTPCRKRWVRVKARSGKRRAESGPRGEARLTTLPAEFRGHEESQPRLASSLPARALESHRAPHTTHMRASQCAPARLPAGDRLTFAEWCWGMNGTLLLSTCCLLV